MTATTAPRAGSLNGPRVLLLVLAIAVAFGAAFAIGKATAGSSEKSGGAQAIDLPSSKPKAPAISAPAALPSLRAAPEPSGGGSTSPPGGGGAAPAPAPTPTPAPAPTPAPPSGGGGGGGGPIIEG